MAPFSTTIDFQENSIYNKIQITQIALMEVNRDEKKEFKYTAHSKLGYW